MADTVGVKPKAEDLYRMIQAKFSGDRGEHVIAREVHNAAGFSFSRRLDAVVMNTWPSKGLGFTGLEIKVTRADFRLELQDTAKMVAFAEHLDYFAIVAPKGLINKDLLHDRWGLYIPDGKGSLKAVRRPLMLHAEKRTTISRSFVAAFTRALVHRDVNQTVKNERFDAGERFGEQTGRDKVRKAHEALALTKTAVDEFEEASGVKITQWNGKKIGDAVAFILRGGLERELSILTQKADSAKFMGQELIKLSDRIRGLTDD